jgi:molybdate transport system ATP-binding protein
MTSWDIDLVGQPQSLALSFQATTTTPLVVMGNNGAGKSSWMAMLVGTLRPTRGRLVVGGRVLFDSDADIDVPIEDRAIGWVPQSLGLFPHATVEEHLRFAARGRVPRTHLRDHVEQHLSLLSLTDVATQPVGALSGGAKQRLALARALACRPKALVLDEPFAALDASSHVALRSWLFAHAAAQSLPVALVTHNPQDAASSGGSVVFVEHGHVRQPPQESR